MPKFRKKPVEIEARQFTGGKGHKALLAWVNESSLPDRRRATALYDGQKVDALVIPTLEGDHLASIGDWIIKGVAGEFYPCKPDIFEATYELVEGQSE